MLIDPVIIVVLFFTNIAYYYSVPTYDYENIKWYHVFLKRYNMLLFLEFNGTKNRIFYKKITEIFFFK